MITARVTRAETDRDIPVRCTCAWTWRTAVRPWFWELTEMKTTCLVHRDQAVTT